MAVPRLAVPAALVWLLVAPAAVWAVARTAGLDRGSLLVQVTAFTPFAAALSAIPLVVALLARNWLATVVAGVACLALAVGVLPRAFGNPSTGTGDDARLTVMSVDMQLGLRVLAGDFNSTLDHVELRRLVNTGYRDAAATVGAGLVPTWPYYGLRSNVTPKVTIDHILVNGSIGVGSFTAVTVPDTDHRAIIATLYIGR